MRLTFVSNYINHHQKPLSDRLYEALGADYTFLQTEQVAAERLNMGWQDMADQIPYVKCFWEDPEGCRQLILDSDVVMFGGQDDESYIEPRLEAGKPVLRYSERLYKTGQWKFISPRGLKKKYHDHTRYRKAPVYLLCAGAYVASDFSLIHAYPGKMLKWGYFPEIKEQDVDALMQGKGKNEILWAGRMIDWKHGEMAIRAAKYLLQSGITDFHLTMVGGGDMEEALKQEASDAGNHISFAGYKTPEEVRDYMEKANIYLFTSDRQEGWGAVLNEAMNSGCAVIASHAIGATPYLLRQGENGLIFKSGDQQDLNRKLMQLIKSNDPGTIKGQAEKGEAESNKPGKNATDRSHSDMEMLGRNAYETVRTLWNPTVAAKRLLAICEKVLKTYSEGQMGKSTDALQPCKLYAEGPGSPAEVYTPGKFRSRVCDGKWDR